MSKNKLTEEQYKKAFDELQASKDTFDALERLADDFNTTPKGLKIGLQRKYPDEYSNWFPLIVKRGEGPTKAELIEKLLDEIDCPGQHVEWLVQRSMKSPLPNETLNEIIQKLQKLKEERKIDKEYIERQRKRFEEAEEQLDMFRFHHQRVEMLLKIYQEAEEEAKIKNLTS